MTAAQTATASLPLDWPTRTNEEWQRSRVDRFALDTRRVAAPSPSSPKALDRNADFAGRLTFVDGVLTGIDLDPALKKAGVVFGPLADAPAVVEAHLAQGRAAADTLASSSHYTRIEFGAVLVVPAKVVAEKPFLVEITETRAGVVTTPHWAVTVGTAAQAALVVRHRSGDQGFTVDSATTVDLGDGSHFTLSDLQTLGHQAAVLDHSFARLGRDAQFFHWFAPIGGTVVKTRFDFTLAGEGASVKTHGLYFGVDDQHKDLRISLNHQAPRTTSYALYKGAVRDRSRTVFQGLIEVNPGASGTDAYLSNKNLVLNDGARADSLPQLKIDTNDVRCSHGSTTGKVNDDEVFYLTTRGFSKEEARLFIAQGLFAELVDEAPAFLKDEVETLVTCALGADADLGVCKEPE
jgi:Fe-S cluster assembly protein SufD